MLNAPPSHESTWSRCFDPGIRGKLSPGSCLNIFRKEVGDPLCTFKENQIAVIKMKMVVDAIEIDCRYNSSLYLLQRVPPYIGKFSSYQQIYCEPGLRLEDIRNAFNPMAIQHVLILDNRLAAFEQKLRASATYYSQAP